MTTEKPTQALLPCPFCGVAPRLVEDFPTDNSRRMEFKVFCPNWGKCDVSPETPFKQFPTQAIDNWNKRISFIDSPACSLSHPEIRYQGETCPLCEALKLDGAMIDELRHERNVLQKICAERSEEIERLSEALTRLRDCDWTISLPDRMDAVRDIARAALSRLSSDPGAGEVKS